MHAVALFLAADVRVRNGRSPLMASALSDADAAQASYRWQLLALLLAGAVLRSVGLNSGLWFDEIRTLLGYARIPLGQILATYDSQNQHVLYSLMAHSTVSTFGGAAWALRLPAVLFGVASLGAVYWFGTRVTSRREAILATALLTVSYHHVWFSQNARGYTALLFFTLVASGILLDQFAARETHSWGPIGAYALAMALAVFTHVTAALVVAAHVLVWLTLVWSARKRDVGASAWLPLAGFLLAATLTLQLYALAFPQFIHTLLTPTMAGVATAWKSPLWFIAETIRGLNRGIPGGAVVVAGAALVGLAGVLSYARQDRTVAAVMVLPGFLTATAVLVTAHNLWPRFFFFCAGFAVLIAVRGVFVVCKTLVRQKGQSMATVALCLLGLASTLTVPRAWQPKQDYTGALNYIKRSIGPADAVVTVDLATYPFAEYLRTDWSAAGNEAELEAIEGNHPRTWVLYTFPERLSATQPEMWARLERDYRTANEFPGTVGGGAIVVKVRP